MFDSVEISIFFYSKIINNNYYCLENRIIKYDIINVVNNVIKLLFIIILFRYYVTKIC